MYHVITGDLDKGKLTNIQQLAQAPTYTEARAALAQHWRDTDPKPYLDIVRVDASGQPEQPKRKK